jgi:DNA-binding NarL/FixJ family response regulator
MTSHEMKIRVLIYSKYTLFREGLKALLKHGDPIEVIAEASTPKQALRLAARLHPDVVLLELTALHSHGSEVTRRLRELYPQMHVLVLSLQDEQDEEHLLSDYLSAGASGYVRKGAQPEQLKGAIYRACRGATFAA